MTGRFIKVGWAASCASASDAFSQSLSPRQVVDCRLIDGVPEGRDDFADLVGT